MKFKKGGFYYMIVVKIFKESAGKINKTSAVTFEACKRRLRLYFSRLEKVKKRLITGEIISITCVTLQKERAKKRKEKDFNVK